MMLKTLIAAALALSVTATAGNAFAKIENNPSSSKALEAAKAAREQAAREQAARENAAREAAEREAAARQASAANEAAARSAARDKILQRINLIDPFTYRPGMSPVVYRKMIAARMKQRHDARRSPGKPPESPADHDHGHGNDDKDHGPHDDHDNGNHNGDDKGK